MSWGVGHKAEVLEAQGNGKMPHADSFKQKQEAQPQRQWDTLRAQ